MKSNLVKGSPIFNEIDSTPIENSSEYKLKLCFCPLCSTGITALGNTDGRGIISWQHICRVILFSLTVKENPKKFFSLKGDMLWFVVDHWFLFGKLHQFRTNPNKWKKAFLDALSHSTYFESGTGFLKKPGYWKLTNTAAPWDEKIDYFSEPIKTKLQLPVILDHSLTQSTLSSSSKSKIEKYCIDARQSFNYALSSLQNQMKFSNSTENFALMHQLKEVQSIMLKTEHIISSIKQLNVTSQIISSSSSKDASSNSFFTSSDQEELNPFDSFNHQWC
ncbi:hypothetical protein EHI8A_029590 [Entamoeba histolytica HM-1:IMSS-B]|uniref:Uncharacterized protein n=4 Tax=Entamoeba histolytica TaxID=5759 RepID=M3S8C9_ENTH1|nr:Hypothetical protein EHI5A_046560 [Entamoeba histolytica KU27]EMH75234.1 hypothetical protein EHI8A_029590 [Entamoeba histolytica HM-1:IMSS-B]EMS16484.1 hypothetical protein KM1_054130 [Entamoeba histolytica HM-3:IMSS]ENY63947.1 hypothetical protein EHI7A_032650 [Entamoeba histolytica HM-1:IMSS-A]